MAQKKWYEKVYTYLFDDGYYQNIFMRCVFFDKYAEVLLRPYRNIFAGSLRQHSKNHYRIVCITAHGLIERNFKTFKAVYDFYIDLLNRQ